MRCLHVTEVNDTGLLFSGKCLSPFLNMLDILASLQSFGRSPVSINTWKIFCNLPSTKIQCKNKIKPIIIKQEGLEKLLSNINPSKSSGPDNSLP
jgi:hypothetical protein